MENTPKLPITSNSGQAEKKTWVLPTVELIGRNTLEGGHFSYPKEGKVTIGPYTSTRFTTIGDGVGS